MYVKLFHTVAIQIIKKDKESNGKSHHAWIVLVQLYSLWYINNPRSVNEDRSPGIVPDSNKNDQNMVCTNICSGEPFRLERKGHDLCWDLFRH